MRLLSFCLLLMGSLFGAKAQQLPTVVNLTAQDSLVEVLNQQYPASLLVASDTSLSKMRATWEDMLIQLEQLSKQEKVDLRGVRLWLKVYWGTDGRIEHLAYQLQPRSLNISHVELQALLRYFVQQYRPALRYKADFAHQTAVSFPTFLQPKK